MSLEIENCALPVEDAENSSRAFTEKFKLQEETDFLFEFDDERMLGVHKIVLARKSKVFHAMFNGALQEKSPVKIIDISYDTFKKLMEVLYEENVKFESDIDVCNFYYAAQKYDCSTALQRAREYMVADLTDDRVEIFYECAKMFEDEYLMKRCLAFYTSKIEQSIRCLLSDSSSSVVEPQFSIETPSELSTAIKKTFKDINEETIIGHKISKELGLIKEMAINLRKAIEKILPSSYKLDLELYKLLPEGYSDVGSESYSNYSYGPYEDSYYDWNEENEFDDEWIDDTEDIDINEEYDQDVEEGIDQDAEEEIDHNDTGDGEDPEEHNFENEDLLDLEGHGDLNLLLNQEHADENEMFESNDGFDMEIPEDCEDDDYFSNYGDYGDYDNYEDSAGDY